MTGPQYEIPDKVYVDNAVAGALSAASAAVTAAHAAQTAAANAVQFDQSGNVDAGGGRVADMNPAFENGQAVEYSQFVNGLAHLPTVYRPSAFMGTYLRADGNSIVAGSSGVTTRNFGTAGVIFGDVMAQSPRNTGYPLRIHDLIGFGGVLNYGVPGSLFTDMAASVLNSHNLGAGSAAAPGLHLLDGLTNNLAVVAGGAGQAKDLLGVTNSLRAMIYAIQAQGFGATWVAATNTSVISYPQGNWQEITDPTSWANDGMKTSLQNNTVVIPITTNRAVVILKGYDDTPHGAAGSTYTWALSGGGASGAGTTSNQMRQTGDEGATAYTACPIALVLNNTGATTGSPKSLTITKTGSTGQFEYCGFMEFSDAQGLAGATVCVVKASAPSGVLPTTCQPYWDAIDAVLTEFDPSVAFGIAFEDIIVGNYDGTHLNDEDANAAAALVASHLITLGYRQGQNTMHA